MKHPPRVVTPPPRVVICKDETTVAAVLSRLGEGASEALDEGRIFVGKRRAVATDKTSAGDEIRMFPARALPVEPPRILLERDGIVAAYKPPDMATVADHRGAAGSLETEVARMLGRKTPLFPTSRLDVGVSGIVLFAADDRAREALSRAREERRYLRHYIAISARAPVPEIGRWTASIGRARDPRRRQVDGRDAVRAETAYATAAVAAKGALLAVEPETGRTHQIRVHAAHAGCPLWGDSAYGGPTRAIAANGAVADVARIALHAAWVEVQLAPGSMLRAEAPLPEDFRAIWTACGGELSAFAAALAADYAPSR